MLYVVCVRKEEYGIVSNFTIYLVKFKALNCLTKIVFLFKKKKKNSMRNKYMKNIINILAPKTIS